jgi:hypothetical protein
MSPEEFQQYYPRLLAWIEKMRRTVPGFPEDSVGRKLHCMSALSPKGGHPSTQSVAVYLLVHTMFREES